MQNLLLIGAILILVIILFIVIFLIIREIIQRTSHRHRRHRHVGFRVIRNQAEFDEFRRGMYVPRVPVVRMAPDSGIDETDTSPGSGEVYHWSASSAGSSTVTPPSRGVSLDVSHVSRRLKAVSFGDSMDFGHIDYDDPTSYHLPTISEVLRPCDNAEPRLTSFASAGRRFTQRPKTPQKPQESRGPVPVVQGQKRVMREFHVINEQAEDCDLSMEPITSL